MDFKIFFQLYLPLKCISNYLISGAVDLLLNPKDEQVTSISGKANVERGVVAIEPLPQSVVKEDDESPLAAVPLSQSAVKENGNLSAAVSLPQSVVKEDKTPDTAIPVSPLVVKKEHNENLSSAASLPQSVAKEDQKLDAAIPISPLAVKKEHDRPFVAVPRSQSPVKDDENEKILTPRPAAREKILKHTLDASPREQHAKKLKSTQQTMQSMSAAVPDKKPFEITSRHAVIFLNYIMLQLYPIYYSCCCFYFMY
jgi:hypothetical protein